MQVRGGFHYASASAAPAGAVPENALDPASGELDEETGIVWYDARRLTVEGQGWTDTEAPWDRLPARAKDTVREPVWNLSRHAAGISVRFTAHGATDILARWGSTGDMPHMPSSGVSGLDFYVSTARGWTWLGVGVPGASGETEAKLNRSPLGDRASCMLLLPLYNSVGTLRIGVPRDARLAPAPVREEPPVVVYGTSITQGGCASRPGACHVAILQRRIDRPFINLGFSGNGRLELELADLLGELDAALYVVDCLPNLGPQDVAERTAPFVRRLRERRPDTPILLVEEPGAAMTPKNAALRKAYGALRKEGVAALSYLPGLGMLGDDGEGTVDGVHPTDLGFMRMADAFEPAIRAALAGE